MTQYRIRIGEKTYSVEIEQLTPDRAQVWVDGRPFTVELQSDGPMAFQAPAPVSSSPSTVPSGNRASGPTRPQAAGKDLRAPMPGVIRQILVKVGDTVKAGQPLVIMEAMKMENELVAPADGRVSNIGVSVGASVNTGDLLVLLE